MSYTWAMAMHGYPHYNMYLTKLVVWCKQILDIVLAVATKCKLSTFLHVGAGLYIIMPILWGVSEPKIPAQHHAFPNQNSRGVMQGE